MSSPATAAELERFRLAIVRALGLELDESRAGLVREVLQRRLEATRLPASHYLAALELEPGQEELRALAGELTIGETYFFRNADQLRAFSAIAAAHAASGRERRLSLLSAGCSTGEEPYTLAMLVRELLPSIELSIRAVDLNPASLERARRARYSSWSLRETSPERRERWFRPQGRDGRDFALDPKIVEAVQFGEQNLTVDEPSLWRPDAYDVVFCRNVLMYFSTEQARGVVARIARSLKPGGHLFLGHAETLRGLSSGFHLLHTHDTFYYQRKLPHERLAETRGAAGEPQQPAPARAIPTTPTTSASPTAPWFDEVSRASARIQKLADAPDAAVETVGTPTIGKPMIALQTIPALRAPALDAALALIGEERYRDALALIPAGEDADPDAQLLRASLLIQCGQLAEAEALAAALLERDELSAGAHYLLALCREAAGDGKGAVGHDQVAAYLEPGFAMPCVHLGLMARRAGERVQARRELTRALELLPGEEAARLLLFGGGFSREALLALCRAELARLEARA